MNRIIYNPDKDEWAILYPNGEVTKHWYDGQKMTMPQADGYLVEVTDCGIDVSVIEAYMRGCEYYSTDPILMASYTVHEVEDTTFHLWGANPETINKYINKGFENE